MPCIPSGIKAELCERNNMNKLLVLFCLLISVEVSAVICTGNVTKVMDYPEMCEGDNMAYKTDNNNDKWFCAISDRSASIVLAALASGKEVTTVFYHTSGGVESTCADLDTSYIKPAYLYIKQ